MIKKMKKIKVEFEVDKNETAIEAYRRQVEDMITSDFIKKSPPLFPKIKEKMTKEEIINQRKQNEEDWKEFENNLDEYRKRLWQTYKNAKIIKGTLIYNDN